MPHRDILTALLQPDAPETVASYSHLPVMQFLRSGLSDLSVTRRPMQFLKAGNIPYTGGLSLDEQAQVSNWLDTHLEAGHKLRDLWMGRAPQAHAYTLIIAARQKAQFLTEVECPSDVADQEQYMLNRAWNVLQTTSHSVRSAAAEDVDVDKECLASLEKQMFEVSNNAGVAGYWQWGLDSGDHQSLWDPYSNLPSYWRHDSYEGNESDLEVWFNYYC